MRSTSAIAPGERFQPVPMGVARGVARPRELTYSDARPGHLYVATERGLAPSGTRLPKGWTFRLVGSVPGHPGPARSPSPPSMSIPPAPSWYGCGVSALCRLKNGQVSEAGESEGLPPDRWEAILEDLEGNIWVRSEHQLAARSPSPAASSSTPPARTPLPTAYPATNAVPPWRSTRTATCWCPPTSVGAKPAPAGRSSGAAGPRPNDMSAVQQDREGSIWIGLLGSASRVGWAPGASGASAKDRPRIRWPTRRHRRTPLGRHPSSGLTTPRKRGGPPHLAPPTARRRVGNARPGRRA